MVRLRWWREHSCMGKSGETTKNSSNKTPSQKVMQMETEWIRKENKRSFLLFRFSLFSSVWVTSRKKRRQSEIISWWRKEAMAGKIKRKKNEGKKSVDALLKILGYIKKFANNYHHTTICNSHKLMRSWKGEGNNQEAKTKIPWVIKNIF